MLRESQTSELTRSWVGRASDEVAQEVGLPASTVNRHVADINRSLTVESRATTGSVDHVDHARDGLETAILHLGVRLASEVTSVSGERYWVDYLRIRGGTVIPLGAVAGPPWRPDRTFPLNEHPFLSEMVVTGQPRAGVLGTRRAGGRVRNLAAQMGIVAGGGVPVKLKNSVHGVLSLSTRGAQPSHELLQHLAAVARIIEAALLNRH